MLNEFSYSVVIPLYQSEETIGLVVDEIQSEFQKLNVENYEIILVNDCSPDNVLKVVSAMAEQNGRLKIVNLVKNSGQTNAALAGFSYAKGDYIISMDDDMQTPGYEIGNLIESIITRDDDIVFASYREDGSKRSLYRRFGTWLNWRMAELMAKKPKGLETNSFYVMKRFVKDTLLGYAGYRTYSYGVYFRITDRISNLSMDHRPRLKGVSGYSLSTLVQVWLDGFCSFSMKPLRAPFVFGLIGFFVWIIISILLVADIVPLIGFFADAKVFWILSGLFGCLVMLFLAVLGEYVGRLVLTESKLPKYIVRGTANMDDENLEERRRNA